MWGSSGGWSTPTAGVRRRVPPPSGDESGRGGMTSSSGPVDS